MVDASCHMLIDFISPCAAPLLNAGISSGEPHLPNIGESGTHGGESVSSSFLSPRGRYCEKRSGSIRVYACSHYRIVTPVGFDKTRRMSWRDHVWYCHEKGQDRVLLFPNLLSSVLLWDRNARLTCKNGNILLCSRHKGVFSRFQMRVWKFVRLNKFQKIKIWTWLVEIFFFLFVLPIRFQVWI